MGHSTAICLCPLNMCQVRERDWCNVITAHEGDPCAYTWRLQHFAIGEHVLRPPAPTQGASSGEPVRAAPVTSVALSACGNFGVVGSAAGRVDRYNMQSGIHRGAYMRGGEGQQSAHEGAVVGVAVDSRNHLLVTCGFDKMLRIWNFKVGMEQGHP
jgi:U3 small nucleolar RNA-associated protein 21